MTVGALTGPADIHVASVLLAPLAFLTRTLVQAYHSWFVFVFIHVHIHLVIIHSFIVNKDTSQTSLEVLELWSAEWAQ